jgi:RHS repeat-associated protein
LDWRELFANFHYRPLTPPTSSASPHTPEKVETSRDRLYWEVDAGYQYYRHGPLARSELGSLKVQGLDYAYTLQGWLKTINGNEVTDGTNDMGGDGRPSMTTVNATALDVVALGLHYYEGDYKAIGEAAAVTGKLHSNIWNLNSAGFGQLFNGNIAAITEHNTRLGLPLAFRYRYDQLNRLVNMDVYNNPWTAAPEITADYQEAISYDPNGNILSYQRNGAVADRGRPMDNLSYTYNKTNGRLSNNKLRYVTDAVGRDNYIEDIDSPEPDVIGDNYKYDEIGNLINEGKTTIAWNVYGKITGISGLKGGYSLEYTYDAAGNRIEKKYSKGTDTHYTWYVRDAQGNVLAVYEKKAETAVRLTESHLYGSSRLGIAKERTKVPTSFSGTTIPIKKHTFTRGEKFFELSNHLGNVLAVVADKKLPVKSTVGNAINFWQADVVTATGYYPFGMPMPGRNGLAYQSTWVPGRGFVASSVYPDYLQVASRPYAPTPNAYRAGKEVELLPGFETATGTDELLVETQEGSGVLSNEYAGGQGSYESYGYYRYGFNGKENDNEVKGAGNQQDYGMRIYDPRLGRFLSVDPIAREYPMLSTYHFAGNRPIVAIDLDGLEPQEHPYSLKPMGKTHLGTTKEGFPYETYKVNSPSYGEVWISKISETQEEQYGFERKPIDHFMYYDKENGWQKWQKGDEPSIPFRQINDLVDGMGTAAFGGAVVGTAFPAASYMGGNLLSINGLFSKNFAIGAGSELVGQLSTGSDVNVIGILSSGFLGNPFVGSFIGSTTEFKFGEGFDIKPLSSNILLETTLGGLLGVGTGKIADRFSSMQTMPWNEKMANNLANGIVAFWASFATNTVSKQSNNQNADAINEELP